MTRVVAGGAKHVVVRRRSFTVEFRRLVAKETLAPGASVSAVALNHGLNTNMLFTWRRRYLRELAGVQFVDLLPVKIESSEAAVSEGMPEPNPAGQSARGQAIPRYIEIDFFGACICLKGCVEAEALRSVRDVFSRR